MDEVGGPGAGGSLPVAWDEARELVAVVLLLTAVGVVVAPIVRELADDTAYEFWDEVQAMLVNVNPISGMMLLGSAVLVCTVSPVDVVPTLRRAVLVVASVVALLGTVAVVLVLTSPSARPDEAVWIRLAAALGRPGPGTLLAGTAAWLARRVVPFPR